MSVSFMWGTLKTSVSTAMAVAGASATGIGMTPAISLKDNHSPRITLTKNERKVVFIDKNRLRQQFYVKTWKGSIDGVNSILGSVEAKQ